jgi:beta-lactamase regulating signal transducer with metallopeptidase domain
MIKVSCIVLVGLVAAALLRQRSAAARHWVLAAAIACAAVTPILEYAVPSWQLPEGVTRIVQRPGTLTLYTPVQIKSTDAAASAAGDRGSAMRATIARTLTIAWFAGIGAGLAILAIGFARLVRITSRARRVDSGTWAALAGEIAGDFGIAPPAILQSDHPSLCVTWGMRRPAVILPRGADAWPEARARSVVGHELAHIARRDWPVQMAAELLRAVYWFNPLVWIACTQLRRESEHACDDAVLALGVQGPEYAGHLLDLARAFKVHGHAYVPAPAMARPSSLERRVRAMLNVHVNRTPLTRSACALVVAALLLVTLPVASAQSGPASFSGTLMDAVGRVMPDVTLTLAPGAAPQKPGTAPGAITATSDANGHFSFANLPAGDYTLQVQKMGFSTTQGRVSVDSGQNLVQNIALQVGALMETITLTEPDPAAPPVTPPAQRPLKSPNTSDDACAQTAVGGCITAPVKLLDVKPIWPASLAGTGTSAVLKMEAHIGTDGFVNDVRVLAPAREEFAAAAAAAIRQWQFSQTLLDGVPVEVRMTVLVNFKAR